MYMGKENPQTMLEPVFSRKAQVLYSLAHLHKGVDIRSIHTELSLPWTSLLCCTRVGTKGNQFLTSCNPDYQPPLYITLTPELAGEDAIKDGTGNGIVDNSGQVSNGLSQV